LFSRRLISGDVRELDDLRGRPELPVFDALAVQAMTCDADGVMQVFELVAIEPDGLLRTPTETLRPRREAQRDARSAVFEDNFDLPVFAA
jgi:hypothetical protein